jgi:hypothetical protein
VTGWSAETGGWPFPSKVEASRLVRTVIASRCPAAAAGLGLPGVTEEQLVKISVAALPFLTLGASNSRKVTLDPILGAYVESVARTDVFKTDLRVERVTANLQGTVQEAIKQEVLWQRWEEEK